jgi:hypothetical protein
VKVSAYKTMDVEFEADVSLEDVLSEFGNIIEESKGTQVNRLTSVLDWMTKLLAAVPDEAIAAMKPQAREYLCERLMDQASRYDDAP